jgi:hypothetical protein
MTAKDYIDPKGYWGEAPASLRKLKPPKEDEFGSKGSEADYFSKLRRQATCENET